MSLLTPYQNMNLLEAQKREGYTDSASFLAELAKLNDLVAFAPWFPANNGTFHKETKATRLGAGGFVGVNSAVPAISSAGEAETERVFFYKGDSEVEETLFEGLKPADVRAVRDSEDAANAEGSMQDWTQKVVYGDGTDPNAPKGIMARLPSIDNARVFDNGGTGSTLTSLLLFEFGQNGFNFRYAPNSTPGISTEDRGRYKNSSNQWVWCRHLEISGGIRIHDNRAMMRLCNIDPTGSTIDMQKFIKMKNFLPHKGMMAMAFGNRSLHAVIEYAAYNKTNMLFTIQDIEGFGPITKSVGIPVMTMEAILDTETALT